MIAALASALALVAAVLLAIVVLQAKALRRIRRERMNDWSALRLERQRSAVFRHRLEVLGEMAARVVSLCERDLPESRICVPGGQEAS